MLPEFELAGSVALVTGGNSGIGRAIAIGLARAGADIAIVARNEEKTARVSEEIRDIGRRVTGVHCDVTRREHILAAVQAVKDTFGKLSILVNAAGIAAGGPAERLSEETWDSVIDTNLKGSFLMAQTAYPLLVANGGGKIINIGSEYAIFGSAFGLPYSASKGGIIQLTKSLAVAWAKDNIQVNAIIPGWIKTDMTAGLGANKAFNDSIIQRTPARRWGEPEEIAGTAVFLASKASSFITGQSIGVDGGYSIA